MPAELTLAPETFIWFLVFVMFAGLRDIYGDAPFKFRLLKKPCDWSL